MNKVAEYRAKQMIGRVTTSSRWHREETTVSVYVDDQGGEWLQVGNGRLYTDAMRQRKSIESTCNRRLYVGDRYMRTFEVIGLA